VRRQVFYDQFAFKYQFVKYVTLGITFWELAPINLPVNVLFEDICGFRVYK